MRISEEEYTQMMKEKPWLNVAIAEGGLPVETWVASGANALAGKYRSRPTIYNGSRFASQKEAAFAAQLDLQIKAGDFDFYLRQVRFPLAGGLVYVADFVLFAKEPEGSPYRGVGPYGDWGIRVLEVKGYETQVWKMKHKLFTERYPSLVIEIV